MARNKEKAGMFKAKEIYLLSGLVKCGECGASMYGNTRMCGRNKSNYSSYRCSGRANKRESGGIILIVTFWMNFTNDFSPMSQFRGSQHC